MKKIIFAALCVANSFLLVNTAQAREIIYEETTTPYIVAQTAPPADQAEVMTASPGANYVWIRGHWKWEGGRWLWETGRWSGRPHPSALWVPGYWQSRHHGWVWIGGHWG